jgi:hypothetical protein
MAMIDLSAALNRVAQAGRVGADGVKDTRLAHINPAEDMLLRALDRGGSINPHTGLPEYILGGGRNTPAGAGSGGARGVGGGRTSGGGGGNRGPISPGAALHAAGALGSIGNDPTRATPGGGTYTSYDYSPGATPNFPDANTAAVVDNVFASAVPVAGAVNTAVKAANTISSGDFSKPSSGLVGSVFGADPGPQRGWAPDRNHGVPNAIGGAQGVQLSSPLGALRYVPIQDPDSYNALLASLNNPKTYSSSDAVIVR